MRKASPFDALLGAEQLRPSLEERNSRIARLGSKLVNGEVLSKEEQMFIGLSLRRIADGANPYQVLDLEVDKPGQRREGMHKASTKKKLAIGWIAAASDRSDPRSVTRKEAIASAARHFGYTPGTMKKMWAQSDKSLDFKL
jgi:hypothetical protein